MLKKMRQIDNIQYFPCLKENHQGQPLSNLCIDPACESKGMICIFCEEQQHQEHQIAHLKQYLKKISLHSYQDFNEKNPIVHHTLEMDEKHQQFIDTLQNFKAKVVEQIDLIITKQEYYFTALRNKVREIYETGKHVDAIVKYHRENFEEEGSSQIGDVGGKRMDYQSAAELKVSKILNWCLIADEEGQKIPLAQQIETALEDCIYRLEMTKTQLKQSSTKLTTDLNKINSTLESDITTLIFTTDLSWNPALKPPNFQIDGNKITKKTSTSTERFALIDCNLNKYIKKKQPFQFTFKISKLIGWIGIGVCFKSKIVNGGFQFSYHALGHGSYMVSSNGYTWSSHLQAENSQSKGYSFTTGDLVSVEFNPKEWVLDYTVSEESYYPNKKLKCKSKSKMKPIKNHHKKKFSIQLESNFQNNEYYPCVNLCSAGDSVQIFE